MLTIEYCLLDNFNPRSTGLGFDAYCWLYVEMSGIVLNLCYI